MRCTSIVLLFTFAFIATNARAQTPPQLNLRKTVVVDVVNKTKDAVVYISTSKIISRRVNPFGFDPFWQEFGGVQRVPANSLGSGFLVHPDGYIVTNNHVVDRARQIKVDVGDKKFDADLISADAEADLAVIKIRSDTKFPILELGDSSDLMIGEPVIAVGNPLGYSHSVSTGIVSAIHRDLKDDQNNTLLGDLIQTDAAINPGNSGGPLLNAYGQVIGINTAIRGDAQNIGFAIPINRLRDLIPALMKPSAVTKVDVPGVNLVEKRSVSAPANVMADVQLNGKSVESINGQPLHNIVDAYASLLKLQPGDEVDLKLRGAGVEKLKATAAPLPDAIVQAKKKLGLVVEPVTPALAEKTGLTVDTGLLVSEVLRNSIGAKAGIQPGDVIVQLGPYPVQNLGDFSNLLQHLPDSGRVRIGVVRENQVGYGILRF